MRLLISNRIDSPMAVGFLHPAIIIPEDLIAHVPGEEMKQILLHEAAHLARRDDWSNLLSRLLGAAFGLHPVAWWILRQIEHEREIACDDWVVSRTGAARQYAETLAHMVELRAKQRGPHRRHEALAAGVFGRRSRIGERIEMLLLRGREFSSRVSHARVGLTCLALCCLAAMGTFAPPWIAFAKTPALNFSVGPSAHAGVNSTRFSSDEKKSPPMTLLAQAAAGIGQMPAPEKQPPAPMFDAISIKAVSEMTHMNNMRMISPRMEVSQRFRARTLPEQMIEWAFGVREFQIAGDPAWLKQEYFDVEATVERTATEDQFRKMVQRLLADRFALRVHREMKQLPVYDLVVGRNGPRLTSNDDPPPGMGAIDIGRGQFIARAATMPLFVSILTDNLDRPVMDKTNLTGHYDFDMSFDFVEGAGWKPIGPVLFTLVQDLGLKLEPQRATAEMLVIDAVSRPTEN